MSTQDVLSVLSTSFSFKSNFLKLTVETQLQVEGWDKLSFGSNNQTNWVNLQMHFCVRIRLVWTHPQHYVPSVTAGVQTSQCTSQTHASKAEIVSTNTTNACISLTSKSTVSRKTSASLHLPGIENSTIFNWQHNKIKSMREKTQASNLCLIPQ